MNIKCPNCKTAYVVPDEKIGDKPKKMRCSRCEEVFTVKRRSHKTPIGYQEFTGAQEALPREFAFLKASDNDPAAASPPPPPERVGPPPLPATKLAENKAKAENAAGGFEEFSNNVNIKQTQPGFGNGLPVVSQAVTPVATAAPGATPSATDAKPSAVTDERTQPGIALPPVQPTAPKPGAGGPSPVQGNPPVHDLYGSASWEMEAPLDLGGYAAPSEKSQKIGKIVAISSGVLVLFLMFVMYRNGWSLSVLELPSQVAFAFSGGEREDFPDEVADLETLVGENRILTAGSKTYLVVTGTIFNNSPVRRSEIMLRGKLRDAGGEVRATTEAPCHIILEDADIKGTAHGQIASHYRKGGTMYDCMIKGESRTVFQLIFETPPADYNPSFEVDVIPIFAK